MTDPMPDLEALIRNTRPEMIEAGPHRDQLARLFLERRAEPCGAAWSLQRYALALWAAILCLGLAVLLQPRGPASHLWAEQRAILSALLPMDRGLPPARVAVPASAAVKVGASQTNINSAEVKERLREECRTLGEVLAEMNDRREP